MSATESLHTRPLSQRATAITQRELAVYMDRTVGLAASHRAGPPGAAARRAVQLPGVRPASDRRRRAQAAWMEDVDGNRYIDFDMGFGALFAGHCHPLVRRAVETQLDNGTLFVTPCEANAEVAELLRDRYGLPMWRFTNSGTEATMDAIRVARGVTGREKIVKVEGGYHGHHDEVMISMKPPLDEAGPADAPHAGARHRRHHRTPCSADTIVIPFNDADCARAGARRRRRRLLHRRAGDGEHRHLHAAARLPRSGPRDHPPVRHDADLRRGEDRHHGRLGRRHRRARRAARPRHAGQEHRRRPAGRRLRRQRRVHGPDHGRRGAAPRHLQRQPAVHGGDEGRARRGVHARGHRRHDRPQHRACSTPCDADHRHAPALPAHTVQFGAKGASRGRRRRSATTATTRPPTSTLRSRSGSTASTAACCCRPGSTSSG